MAEAFESLLHALPAGAGEAETVRDLLPASAASLMEVEHGLVLVLISDAPRLLGERVPDLVEPVGQTRSPGRAMDADPGLAVVAAKRHMIDESSRILVPHRGLHGMIGVRTYVDVARRVVRNGANPIGEPGGVLFRRDDYDAVGGWNPERCYAMDLDLWLRLLCRGDFLGLPVSLAAFRIAHTSLSADNSTGIDEHQRAIVAELVASGDLLIRRRDRLAGRLNTPIARLRRRALFALSSRAARREERSHSPQGSSSSDATADGNPEPGVAHQRTVDDVRVAS
jgi:hypothetical protein